MACRISDLKPFVIAARAMSPYLRWPWSAKHDCETKWAAGVFVQSAAALVHSRLFWGDLLLFFALQATALNS